jgi:hypothetical protein
MRLGAIPCDWSHSGKRVYPVNIGIYASHRFASNRSETHVQGLLIRGSLVRNQPGSPIKYNYFNMIHRKEGRESLAFARWANTGQTKFSQHKKKVIRRPTLLWEQRVVGSNHTATTNRIKNLR